MTKDVVVAVDIGTSGVRTVAFSATLGVEASVRRSFSFKTSVEGRAEQDVYEVVDATLSCIKDIALQVEPSNIMAIALSGTASCLAAFKPDPSQPDKYIPISPAWIWADVRARTEVSELVRDLGEGLYTRTGCPTHASYWPAKLRLCQKQYSQFLSDNGFKLAGIKDYIFYKLTGEWLMDVTTASATGLYDSDGGCWDTPTLDWLGLSADKLPQVVDVTEYRQLLIEQAQNLDLVSNIPIVVGSLDGVLVHLGSGCHGPSMASCMIGTSGAVRLGATTRTLDKQARTWSYPLTSNYWVMGGANNNGGNILDWSSKLFQGLMGNYPDETDAENLLSLAFQSKPGANGLIFLPYVYGERSPLWREDIKGAWVGLGPNHRTPELIRSIVEGISLNLASILETLTDQVGIPQEARAAGGFTASPMWLQLQADVFGLPIQLTSPTQSTAAGAAIVGWSALTDTRPESWTDHITVDKTIQPNSDYVREYQAIYQRFSQIRTKIL